MLQDLVFGDIGPGWERMSVLRFWGRLRGIIAKTRNPGLLIYYALRSSPLDITIIASGFVASSATIVLLGAEKRFCTQNTNFLVHPVSSFMFGRLPDVKNQLAYGEILESQFVNIYQKHTKITKEMMQQETYFDSAKALNLQLVSEII